MKLWAVLIGVVAGAIGYWFSIFSMQPILRFRDLKNRILIDFIYYAHVVKADHLNDDMKVLCRERVLANRKTSAQLSAAMQELPWWYLRYLGLRQLAPEEAAKGLMEYSNTTENKVAHKIEDAIRRNLGLPERT